MLTTFNGEQVEFSVQHESDPCDSFVTEAVYVNTGIELSEEECQILTDEAADLIFEDYEEHCRDQSDWLYEQWKDRQSEQD